MNVDFANAVESVAEFVPALIVSGEVGEMVVVLVLVLMTVTCEPASVFASGSVSVAPLVPGDMTISPNDAVTVPLTLETVKALTI